MATPRKHWFKVADSIADEDWSNDVLATLIRLQARMNTRWARNGLTPEQAAEITLTAGDVMTVTRRSRVDRGIALVRECQRAVTMVVRVDDTSVTVIWPKWPEFQGLPNRDMPKSRPRVAPSETQTQTQTQTPPQDARLREKTPNPQTPSAPPAARARVRRSAGHVDPRVETAWPLIRAAFAEHGVTFGETVALDRSRLIAKRIDAGASTDDLVAAVHGYVRSNGLERRPDGFDPRRYFRPQTVFKEEGFSDRVDAGRGPRVVGSGVSKAAQAWGLR